MTEMNEWMRANWTGTILEEGLLEAVEEFTAMTSNPVRNYTQSYLLVKLAEYIENMSECRVYLERDLDKRAEFSQVREKWLEAADGMMYKSHKGD